MMGYKEILSAIAKIALYLTKLHKKSEKESYEDNRLKENSSAADDFERKFNPNGLCVDKDLPGNKTDSGKGS